MDKVDKNKVEKEAKEILNKFSKELEKLKNLKEEDLIIRKESLRTEKNGECEMGLKQRILKNAENKNKDFIIAKEKSW
jgi:vacuolar-type H+-ATPase subunit E/Vma4